MLNNLKMLLPLVISVPQIQELRQYYHGPTGFLWIIFEVTKNMKPNGKIHITVSNHVIVAPSDAISWLHNFL